MSDYVKQILRDAGRKRTRGLTIRTEEIPSAGPWNDETKRYDDLVVEFKLAPSKDITGRYSIYIDGVTIGWVSRQDYGEHQGAWTAHVSNDLMDRQPSLHGYLIARTSRREDAIWEILYEARHRVKAILAEVAR